MAGNTGKKRSRKRSRLYRKVGMIINMCFFVIIIAFIIVGALHTFTHKRSYRDEGVSLYNEQSYSEAIAMFDKALDCKQWFSGKLNVDISLYKADCYFKLGEYDEAGDVYRDITDRYSSRYYDEDEISFLAKLCDALLQYKNRDYYSPVSCFNEAVERGYTDMYIYAAYCYEMQEKYDNMTSCYDNYIEKVGITSYVAYKYADYYIYAGDYASALEMVNSGLASTDGEYTQKLKFLEILCYDKSADYENAYNLAVSYNAAYPDDEDGADILAYLDTRVNVNTSLVNDIYNVGNGQ